MTSDYVSTESLSDNPLPELIKKIRNTNNLTQASFGKLFQPPVTQPTVARWEKGEQVPDRIHFPKIASFLNITFEELLELIEAPQTLAISLKIENKTLTPNKKHLSILNRGVKAWNRWRIKNPDVIPDLAGADSIPYELSEVDLSDANLRGLNIYGTDLSDAKLVCADLREAILNNVNFGDADLRGANLSGAIFKNTYFTDANLSRTNLSGAILKGCCFYKANLEDADISNADLSSADLRGTNLNQANLEYANLSFSYVYGVSIWNIKLEGAVQKKLNICPWKTEYIYVNDIRSAYIKSLQIANSEDTKISIIAQDFQAALESQNKSFKERINQKNNTTGGENED